jgi:acetolactate synthase-1/2/3 large subunit
VTIVVLANRSYAILKGEFANVGAGTPGQKATDMISLDRPHLDWLALANGDLAPRVAAATPSGRGNDRLRDGGPRPRTYRPPW